MLSEDPSPCADDLNGYKPLSDDLDDTAGDPPVLLSAYHRDFDISRAIQDLNSHLGRHRYTSHAAHAHAVPALHTPHARALLPILNRLRVPREQLLRSPASAFLEYAPWVRFMVAVDDAQVVERVAAASAKEGTRRTRNSQRLQMERVRWIALDEDGRDVLRRTTFEV